jgi:RNA polymerase sigma factor (sigma-70 family)
LADQSEIKFRRMIVPHFDAAFNLARWLMGNEDEASDILQDSSLKAFRSIHSLKSENARAWFFQIIRNTAYTQLKNRKLFQESEFDGLADTQPSAETLLIENASAKMLHEALALLAIPFREILILRELEELPYEDIAEILQIPQGTVMSRLARAREQLKIQLGGRK